jgi:hypothetical protein
MSSIPPVSVSRVERMLDFTAVALVIAGTSLYVYAYAGMRQLAGREGAPPAAEMLLPHFDAHWRTSRWAVAVGVGGIALAVGAAIARGIRRRRAG